MKKAVLFILLLSVLIISGQDDFNKWLKDQEKDFTSWKSQQDKNFSEFLKNGWSYYKTEEPVKQDTIPKPEEIPNPVDQNCPDLVAGNMVELKINDAEMKTLSTSDILKEVQHEQLMYAVSKGTETLHLSYWGLIFNLNYNINMKIENIKKCNSAEIASFWGRLSNTDYELILKDLQKMRERFRLNDWAYCQLIYHTGEEIFQDQNMSNLFTWFTLTKNAFNCKAGYNEDEIYLLLATQNKIYGEPHLVLDGRDFYSIDLSNNNIKPINIYTYDGEYPEADDLIDLNITSSPYLNEVVVEKKLLFSYGDSTWTIPIRQNQTLVEFLAEYPATDLAVYFKSDVSPILRESLIAGLEPIIDNRTEAEALNILLRFVQTAFKYQTDDQQFGEENSLFPDETVFYEYCDCEDRSFLFSWLVREFLGLEVIGLDYPGHIATAVQMNFDIEGDKINFNGTDYLVCDPTYINADIGVIMPQFLNVEPEIIQFQ